MNHKLSPMRFKLILSALFLALASLIARAADPADKGFVTVKDGEFMLHGKSYRYVGTNLWYGAILGSEGEGGDRERLARELDSLQAMGIDNLRVLAGGDGNRTIDNHIEPNLQIKPGVYDDKVFAGLDYLLAELEKRDMRAVIYLNNSWEWSGGYGTYLEWAGYPEAPLPNRDGYNVYTKYASQFVTEPKALDMFRNHIRKVVGRVSTVTGKPYTDSPAIMAWQICNEPRSFNRDNAEAFKKWLISSAELIKELDKNHLVSTGSEGYNGCEGDLDLWAAIHNNPVIDYALIHIWPVNWNWCRRDDLEGTLQNGIDLTREYIDVHRARTSKPLVIEEFGFPRDSMAIAIGTPVKTRDAYYKVLLDIMTPDGAVNGLNFWGWGGTALPPHRTWQPGDPYTGDPAQEDQGLYSVYSSDRSTIDLIRDSTARLKKQMK